MAAVPKIEILVEDSDEDAIYREAVVDRPVRPGADDPLAALFEGAAALISNGTPTRHRAGDRHDCHFGSALHLHTDLERLTS